MRAPGFLLVSLALLCLLAPAPAACASAVDGMCRAKGIRLAGKVRIVRAFPDLRVQVVRAFPDLRVELVSFAPARCGEWQIVDAFEDFTIQIVDAFPDVKIQIVDSFPGRP